MKKSISLFLILSASLAFLFSLGFSPEGDKVPMTKSSNIGPNIIYGPETENPPTSLFESFESTSFPPAGWFKINPLGGTGWTRQTVGTSPMPGWFGGVISAPPGGQSAIAYCTWNSSGPNSTDQWLVTPRLLNVSSQDSLAFRIKYPGFSHNYQDFVEIMISTTTPDMSSFFLAHTMHWSAGTNDTNWVRRSFKITSFPGVTEGANIYVAFREKVSNNYTEGGAIFLDITEVTTLTKINLISSEIPGDYSLSQNYPNPFNPSTKIRFDLPQSKGIVKLSVFNSLGQVVSTLVDRELSAGSYEYTFDGAQLTSGIYFYKLEAGDFVETKRMLMVK
jgi:hypothetical protein